MPSPNSLLSPLVTVSLKLEKKKSYDITYMGNQKKKKDTHELIYKTERDSQT